MEGFYEVLPNGKFRFSVTVGDTTGVSRWYPYYAVGLLKVEGVLFCASSMMGDNPPLLGGCVYKLDEIPTERSLIGA